MKKYKVGGIYLSSGNAADPAQLTQLTEDLQACSRKYTGLPLIIGADEEGGTVLRIANNPVFGLLDAGRMSDIGKTGKLSNAYWAGKYIGKYLHKYGITQDLAPVADVLTNPRNTVIGSRSFGSDPALVAKMDKKYLEGLHFSKVSGCLKHFPGHGATSEDSHFGAAVLQKDYDQLKEVDLYPFQQGVEYGAECIMAGHISLPKITGNYIPACLSRKIVTGILRKDMGYHGLVITDSICMEAVTDKYGTGKAAVMAIKAGNDMVLSSGQFQSIYDALYEAAETGAISQKRLKSAVKRVLVFKMKNG